MFLQGKVNSARYIAHVVLVSFLRQEGDVLFQQDNACPHTAAVMLRALCGVRLPGEQDPQIQCFNGSKKSGGSHLKKLSTVPIAM